MHPGRLSGNGLNPSQRLACGALSAVVGYQFQESDPHAIEVLAIGSMQPPPSLLRLSMLTTHASIEQPAPRKEFSFAFVIHLIIINNNRMMAFVSILPTTPSLHTQAPRLSPFPPFLLFPSRA